MARLERSVATVATLICLSAQVARALYLTQVNSAPCTYLPELPPKPKVLDCSNRGLTEVPGVDSAMSVNAFYLDDNAIVTIGPNAFANLTRSLTFLSVKSSALMDRIDNAAFAGLTSLITLVVQGGKDSEKSMNKVNLAQLLSGLRALSSVSLNSINVNDLPSGFAGGTSLADLSVVRTAIATISLTTFANASSLRTLDMSYNTFGDTVTGMNWLGLASSLETGVFIGSKITSLGQMPSLTRLKKLDFTNNALTSLDTNSLSNVAASLQELLLSNNPIPQTNTAGLAGLSALKRLVMTQNNKLGAIPPEVKLLQALELLDLRGTQVSGLGADSFHPSSRLRSLMLDFTSVHSLHALAFAKVSATLEEFTLTISGLSTAIILNTAGVQQTGNWSVILAQVPRLQNLTLNGMGMDDANTGGLKNDIWSGVKMLPSLRRLSLEYNKITAVPDFYLAEFANLTYVSLKGNAIARLTSAAFYGTGGAQVVLKNNSLTAIDNCTLAMFRNLSGLVSLDGNPFTCDCALQWLWRRVKSDSPANLPAMSCSLPAALAGKTWDTLTEPSFCSSGEMPPSNCRVQAPSTAPPPTTPSFPYLLNITVTKISESSVSLEASVGSLARQFTGYTVKYWPVTRPEAALNVSLLPMKIGAVTLQIRANELYRFCYVLLNGSSAPPVESPANCRDYVLSGLASAAVIAIVVLAAIIGTALVFAAVCLLCKRLRQAEKQRQAAEEDPYTYTYPDDKQIGKSNNNGGGGGNNNQFQPTLRPESKRYSKRSRNNLAGSRPSLATSTTTLATCRMSSPGGFAVQNGARPVSGGAMMPQAQQQPQRPSQLSSSDFVQPSQSMHSIAEATGGCDRRFAGDSGGGFQQQRQLMSRSQDQLSEAPSAAPPNRRSARGQLPLPPRHAQSQELVLDVTRAAGGAGSAHYLHQQQPPLPLPPPPPRSHRGASSSQLQPTFNNQMQRNLQHHQPLEHGGENGYVPMLSSADLIGDSAGLGESSTDDPRQYPTQQQQQPLSLLPTYNPYLTDEQFEEATSPQQPLPPQVRILPAGNGGVDNSAFQRNDTSGYYEMGQF